MKRIFLVAAVCLLLLPTVGLANTMNVSFVGGQVLGPSDSLGTLGINGAGITSFTIDGAGVTGVGSITISLSAFQPTIHGKTITTGGGVFGAGFVTDTCTDCDGYAGLVYTGNLAGLDWIPNKGGSSGILTGSITGAFSPGFGALVGTATDGSFDDTLTVHINTRTAGVGDLSINFTPIPKRSPVPEPATLSLLGSGLLGLLGLASQRREAL